MTNIKKDEIKWKCNVIKRSGRTKRTPNKPNVNEIQYKELDEIKSKSVLHFSFCSKTNKERKTKVQHQTNQISVEFNIKN